MKRLNLFILTAIVSLMALSSATLQAQWPVNGACLGLGTGNQQSPVSVSDGVGGAINAWTDYRSGYWNIYAQRIDASGSVKWDAAAVAVCSTSADQIFPAIGSDGTGGAIITWCDYRSGTYDIYAQRIDTLGNLLWTTAGAALCTAPGNQVSPAIVSDGAGGAIITWYDYRSGSNWDIYAQRVDSLGAVKWEPGKGEATVYGAAICTATGDQYYPTIASDGAGGAIITWYDYRSGTSNADIYAQRISSSGFLPWAIYKTDTQNGVTICTATGNQYSPTIASDGAGGAIITWYDYRSGTNYDIFAQRINSWGTSQWTANGTIICNAVLEQSYPTIVSDGAKGAIITWQDYRSGASNADIYAQRIDSLGTVKWEPVVKGVIRYGKAICAATGIQEKPAIVSDDAGGAIITWMDFRTGTNYQNGDIYAQRINTLGAVQWTTDGAAVCTAPYNQVSPTIVSDGVSGAIIAWVDYRDAPPEVKGTNVAIYTSRVTAAGSPSAVEMCSFTAISQPGQVEISWSTASELNSANWLVERSNAPDNGYLTLGKLPASGNASNGSQYSFVDHQAEVGVTYYYKIAEQELNGKVTYYGPVSASAGIFSGSFENQVSISPNPCKQFAMINYQLAKPGMVSARIYNLLGQQVRTVFSGSQQAGAYSARWDGKNAKGQPAPAGVYVLRLSAGEQMFTKRITLIK
jgi:hypothetical protein